jgi:hypothetical protein
MIMARVKASMMGSVENDRASSLRAILPYLPEPLRSETASEGYRTATQIDDIGWRARKRASYGKYVTEAERLAILEELRQVDDMNHRIEGLAQLALSMDNDAAASQLFDEAMNAALPISLLHIRANASTSAAELHSQRFDCGWSEKWDIALACSMQGGGVFQLIGAAAKLSDFKYRPVNDQIDKSLLDCYEWWLSQG